MVGSSIETHRTLVLRESNSERNGLDLLPEDVTLVKEQNDRRVGEPLVVAHIGEQLHAVNERHWQVLQ